MINLKEIVYADIGPSPGVPVGTIEEYIYLDEVKTVKRLYQRLNRTRTSGNYLIISDCVEHAQVIRSRIFDVEKLEKL